MIKYHIIFNIANIGFLFLFLHVPGAGGLVQVHSSFHNLGIPCQDEYQVEGDTGH